MNSEFILFIIASLMTIVTITRFFVKKRENKERVFYVLVYLLITGCLIFLVDEEFSVFDNYGSALISFTIFISEILFWFAIAVVSAIALIAGLFWLYFFATEENSKK